MAGFVSALRGTVASTGGSGLVWVAVTDGAAGGFGASLAAAERSTAGAGFVWFPGTEGLEFRLALFGRQGWALDACLLGLGFRWGRLRALLRGGGDDRPLAAGAGFGRLSTGAGFGSDFGGSTAATGRSAAGAGFA